MFKVNKQLDMQNVRIFLGVTGEITVEVTTETDTRTHLWNQWLRKKLLQDKPESTVFEYGKVKGLAEGKLAGDRRQITER